MTRPTSLALLLGGWFLLVGQGSCSQKDTAGNTAHPGFEPTVSFVDVEGGEVHFQVEIAENPEDRAQGLMFRKELPPNRGMLFIFSHMGRHSFFMKNTHIPLDIIFLDRVGPRARVVGILHDMKPLDEASRSIEAPAMAALEVRAGLAKKHGIQIGSEARIQSGR